MMTKDFVWVVKFEPNMGDEVNCLIDYNKPYYQGWFEVYWDQRTAERKALSFVTNVLSKSDLVRFVRNPTFETVSAWNSAFPRFKVEVFAKEIS